MGIHRRENDARTYRIAREFFFFETNREKVHREFLRETRDLEEDARRDGTTTFARGGDDDDGCDDGDGRRLDRVSLMWRRNERVIPRVEETTRGFLITVNAPGARAEDVHARA